MRETALHAVRATGQTEAYLPQIVELFKDPEPSVREAAVRAVGAPGQAEAYLPQIVKLFKDPEPSVAGGGGTCCWCDGSDCGISAADRGAAQRAAMDCP